MLQNDPSIRYIWAAPPEKRYKHFIHTVADQESLWLAGNENGELVAEKNGKTFLCLWPSEAFAQFYLEKTVPSLCAEIFSIEISAFMDHAQALTITRRDIQCMVFPTEQNATYISMQELLADLNTELECY